MSYKMRWAKIRKEDIANGPGVRVSIYVQGCNHHCKGCFNPETWDFGKGNLFNRRIETQFLELANNKKIAGFSILGGEPLQQGDDMLTLVKAIRNRYGDTKTIWMWTGCTYEELNDLQKEIVSYVDILIDGKFEIDKVTRVKAFKGSSNQRIINIKETIKNGFVTIDKMFGK